MTSDDAPTRSVGGDVLPRPTDAAPSVRGRRPLRLILALPFGARASWARRVLSVVVSLAGLWGVLVALSASAQADTGPEAAVVPPALVHSASLVEVPATAAPPAPVPAAPVPLPVPTPTAEVVAAEPPRPVVPAARPARSEPSGAPEQAQHHAPAPPEVPKPEPEPGPAPGHTPDSATDPRPEPEPDPAPGHTPESRPEPDPAPGHTLDPKPEPEPDPAPGHTPEPRPEPEPAPGPTPDPDPEPEPDPGPEKVPDPEPEPNPDRTPDPKPAPEADPEPEPVAMQERPDRTRGPVGETPRAAPRPPADEAEPDRAAEPESVAEVPRGARTGPQGTPGSCVTDPGGLTGVDPAQHASRLLCPDASRDAALPAAPATDPPPEPGTPGDPAVQMPPVMDTETKDAGAAPTASVAPVASVARADPVTLADRDPSVAAAPVTATTVTPLPSVDRSAAGLPTQAADTSRHITVPTSTPQSAVAPVVMAPSGDGPGSDLPPRPVPPSPPSAPSPAPATPVQGPSGGGSAGVAAHGAGPTGDPDHDLAVACTDMQASQARTWTRTTADLCARVIARITDPGSRPD